MTFGVHKLVHSESFLYYEFIAVCAI